MEVTFTLIYCKFTANTRVEKRHATRMMFFIYACGMARVRVCWFITLVQTEISQQLLDTDIHGPQKIKDESYRISCNKFADPLAFQLHHYYIKFVEYFVL